MKRIKEILEKFKNFLKRLLKKENILLISENGEIQQTTKVEEDIISDTEIDKKEFFELYKNVKNGKVSMDNLMLNDLIKVLLMMKNEVLVYDDKIKSRETDIIDLDTEIKMLERENELIRLRMQSQSNWYKILKMV